MFRKGVTLCCLQHGIASVRMIEGRDSLFRIILIGNECRTCDVGILLSVECIKKSLTLLG